MPAASATGLAEASTTCCRTKASGWGRQRSISKGAEDALAPGVEQGLVPLAAAPQAHGRPQASVRRRAAVQRATARRAVRMRTRSEDPAFNLGGPQPRARLLHRRQCPRADGDGATGDDAHRRRRLPTSMRPSCSMAGIRRLPVPQLHGLRPALAGIIWIRRQQRADLLGTGL